MELEPVFIIIGQLADSAFVLFCTHWRPSRPPSGQRESSDVKIEARHILYIYFPNLLLNGSNTANLNLMSAFSLAENEKQIGRNELQISTRAHGPKTITY